MKQDLLSYINLNETDIIHNRQKLTYTIPEVAETLNISISQAYKLANQDGFPVVRFGKRILVSVKKLEEFINK